MAFTPRTFEEATRIMQAGNPDVPVKTGVAEHYASEAAVSFDELGAWSDDPPVPLISLQRITDAEAIRLTRDPKALVDYANFGGAVGTWNANGEGRWASSPGEWIVVDVELVQEQAEQDPDYYEDAPGSWVYIIFALWKVAEGWACAIWSPQETDHLAMIMGLEAWPAEGWQATRVWYGE